MASALGLFVCLSLQQNAWFIVDILYIDGPSNFCWPCNTQNLIMRVGFPDLSYSHSIFIELIVPSFRFLIL